METKPYVTHKGIKRIIITVATNWGEATVTEYTPRKVQGRRVIETDLKVKGTPVYIDLDKHPEIEAQITAANEKYEQDFTTRYPGIYELVAAQNDDEYRYERLQREIERGAGVLSNSHPDRDPADVAKQYPIASAYLDICNYADADPSSQVGYDKRTAGKWAIEQLELDCDVIQVRDEMIARYQAARKADTTSIWA